jgi:hypothetical protein
MLMVVEVVLEVLENLQVLFQVVIQQSFSKSYSALPVSATTYPLQLVVEEAVTTSAPGSYKGLMVKFNFFNNHISRRWRRWLEVLLHPPTAWLVSTWRFWWWRRVITQIQRLVEQVIHLQ